MNGRKMCLNHTTNTIIGSQLLFPTASVPVGMAKDAEHAQDPELSMGLVILGLPLQEQKLLAIAAGVEEACERARVSLQE
jgi:Asp-tRNA(Asn)/Glu-tRNA(Gln) amidotransferase A subunit family amidase